MVKDATGKIVAELRPVGGPKGSVTSEGNLSEDPNDLDAAVLVILIFPVTWLQKLTDLETSYSEISVPKIHPTIVLKTDC